MLVIGIHSEKSAAMIFFRYIIVAGVAYGIDFGGFIFLLGVGFSPVVANAMIKIVAAIFGFFGHRYFSFAITERADIGRHALKYFGMALFYTPVSSFVLYCIMYVVSNPVYAKILADISLLVLMFWITLRFSFGRHQRSAVS